MSRVIIVGAGPTGASLALMLAQRGITVTLIEATRDFARTFRGEALMPSGIAALESMGLADLITTIPHRALSHWEFWIEGQKIFDVEEPIHPQPKPCTLVSQTALLNGIVQQAQKLPNFSLEQGCSVRNLISQNDRVQGVQLSDGRELTADLVIGCDGRHSIVRQKAGLGFQAQTDTLQILWFRLDAGQLFAEGTPFCTIVQGEAAFGVFRSSDGGLQIGWSMAEADPTWKDCDWLKRLSNASPDWLAEHFQTYASSLEPPVRLSVVVGRCKQWHRPGVIVLGDAAHPMSPIRAQGINMALRDVVIAVNELVPILKTSEDIQPSKIDAAMANIQAAREAEIIRIQALQNAELHDAEKLRKFPVLREFVRRSPQWIRLLIKTKWLWRQRQLRSGLADLALTIDKSSEISDSAKSVT